MGVLSGDNKFFTGLRQLYALANDCVQETELSNGISFLSQRRFLDNNIRFSVRVNSGSFDDPLDKQGVGHFLEHILVDSQINAFFQNRGGHIGLATSANYIELSGSLPKSSDAEDLIVSTMKDFLTGAGISAESYNREQKRILNEIGIYHDNPSSALSGLLGKAFSNGRSRNNMRGTREEVKSISIDDLKKYLQDHFVGNNVSIGMTGSFDHSAMKTALENGLPNLPAQENKIIYKPEQQEGFYPNFNEHLWQVYFSFNFPIEPLKNEETYLHFMSIASLEQQIVRDIVFKAGVLYEAGSDQYAHTTFPGHVGIYGNVMPEDADQIMPQVRDLIVKNIENTDPDTFNGIKTGWLGNVQHARFLFPPHEAGGLTMSKVINGGIFPGAVQEAMIKEVTAETVQTYLTERVFSNAPTIVTYGDHSKMGTYDAFVEPIQKAITGVDNKPKMP